MVMKIIGIGLPRTATTSLHRAFEILGYKSKHSNHVIHPDEQQSYNDYDCFCDTPYYYLYKEIDRKFPNTKFIHTHRSLDNWLNSWERLYNQDGPDWVENCHLHNVKFFGQRNFDRRVWTEKYYEHHSDVEKYFKDRGADLLRIDITTCDDNWKLICDFLSKKIPTDNFPNIDHLKDEQYT
jgi:hypothetical protein